jgi:SAM-dependent methyltransferase
MCPLLEKLRDDHGSKQNVAGAVQALPFRDEVFDAVCCIDLVHHEPDRLEDIFNSFSRILKPGGRLFLEDINAWGLLQFWKSKLMPRKMHSALREMWHGMKGSEHRPASYEFPTDVFETIRLLARSGFRSIEAAPLRSYPNTGRAGLAIYRWFSSFERIRRYHNFHYLISAEKE